MIKTIKRLFNSEVSGGVLLIAVTFLALICANGPLHDYYHNFLHYPLGASLGSLAIVNSLEHLINDGLMTIFFLLVGLEVKRELMVGTLVGRSKALFPAFAALGGMIAPALIYLLFNGSNPLLRQGWAIPTATDIAFSLGVLALLGKMVDSSLKSFLLALAIIDDLGAVIIIALFYTEQLLWPGLALSALVLVALAALNLALVRSTLPYLLLGAILWIGLLISGIHATLAGVITGFFIPLCSDPPDALSPLDRLAKILHPWVIFLILPLFAFVNAGVSLQGLSAVMLFSQPSLGIAAALVIGKPLGIFTFSWLSVRLGFTNMPNGANFRSIFGVSVLCGIGFTMSIFIATLGFGEVSPEYANAARLGILIGSTVAALAGYCTLRLILPPRAGCGG